MHGCTFRPLFSIFRELRYERATAFGERLNSCW